VIEISHLSKKYGNYLAVDDLSLTFEPGRIYGFLGPNGAGKSTTMNMITGYLGFSDGSIHINGSDILDQPEQAKKMYRVFTRNSAVIHRNDSQRVS